MPLTVQNSSPALSRAGQVYWIGTDGNIWLHNSDGSASNLGAATGTGTTANLVLNGAREIDNPVNAPSAGSSTSFSGGSSAQDAVDRGALQSEIAGKAGQVDSTYADLFGGLDNVVRDRGAQLETQYGDQLSKAGRQYADAIPQIETSYAAIGAGDSTDNSYAKVGAKKGFEDTTKTIGTNKQADQAKLGQYKTEQEAKFNADKTSAQTNIARAGSTTDVGALRTMRNDLEANLSGAGVTKATLGTDGAARQTLSNLTADGGRYEAATNALDGILKSSLSGSVKEAAVKAVTDSAGLSDEEKKKVAATYGNVYADQATVAV